MYENKKQKYLWIAYIPACFYTLVTVSYILNAQIGFRQSWTVAYAGGFIAAAIYFALLAWYGNKRAKMSKIPIAERKPKELPRSRRCRRCRLRLNYRVPA